MTDLLVGYLVLAALALVQSALMILAAWEHRRFARSRARRPMPSLERWPVVAIYAPIKGLDLRWDENLRALFEQDYPNYRLVFVLESESDAAYTAILQVASQYPLVPWRVVVAGEAQDCGQKVHNLRVATAEIDPDTEVLAFVDSDARPASTWLRWLVYRLLKPGVGATTGYRWFIPTRDTWANRLLVCLNSPVAGLLGPHRYNLIWGGSWVIRRETFEELGIAQCWKEALSDDLAASCAIRRAGGTIAFEPHCWLPAPADMDLPTLWTFARRQYMLVRLSMPARWWLVLGAAVLRVSAFWGGVLISALAAIMGWPWILPATFVAALYGTLGLRAHLRHSAVRNFLEPYWNDWAPAARLDIFGAPLVALLELAVLIASAFGRRFRWRGIEYYVHRDGRVEILSRERAQANGPHRRCATPTSLTHTSDSPSPIFSEESSIAPR